MQPIEQPIFDWDRTKQGKRRRKSLLNGLKRATAAHTDEEPWKERRRKYLRSAGRFEVLRREGLE